VYIQPGGTPAFQYWRSRSSSRAFSWTNCESIDSSLLKAARRLTIRTEISNIEPLLAILRCSHCCLSKLFWKLKVVCTRAGGTAMLRCMQADNYGLFNSGCPKHPKETRQLDLLFESVLGRKAALHDQWQTAPHLEALAIHWHLLHGPPSRDTDSKSQI
jgi:hypothetical protein